MSLCNCDIYMLSTNTNHNQNEPIIDNTMHSKPMAGVTSNYNDYTPHLSSQDKYSSKSQLYIESHELQPTLEVLQGFHNNFTTI